MRFSELEGKRIGVWGAGREARSFARQLHERLPSARITSVALDSPLRLADDRQAAGDGAASSGDDVAEALGTPTGGDVGEALGAPGARLLRGAQIAPGLSECDVVVRSPGVSIHRREIRELRAAGVVVTTATALWLAERGGERTIGLTGTKGKSTTAALAAHLARATGCTVALAGNIGVPALDLLDDEPAQVTVLELSSYQIADLQIGPEVALVTNVYREHLDWHGSEEAYRKDKLRLLDLPGVRAVALNARDERLATLAQRLTALAERLAASGSAVAVTRFGTPDGWDTTGEGIALNGELQVATEDLPLRGEHNELNLCGALAALEAFGLPIPPLSDALADFRPLPHRLQPVCEREGVLWIDDSISTTPESALAALAAFPERDVILIAGGQDRGQDYRALARALQESGATLIAVPSTGERLLHDAKAAGMSAARALCAADIPDAVEQAGKLAQPSTVILLSPAAPSFDSYRDFEERGEHFSELVMTG